MSKTSTTRLDDSSANIASMTADDFAKASLATSTRREYAKDVAYFQQDCALPATPTMVADWLAKVASKLAPATIQRRMIAVHAWHKQNGHASPILDGRVKQVFSGITRTVGGGVQRAVKPLMRDDLLAVLAAVERQRPLRAARDSALLLVMFSGALRRQSAADLRVDDITSHEYGIDILLRKSKTDQAGKGLVVSIPFAFGDRCPVKAIAKWRELAGIESGYLFRSVSHSEVVGTTRLDVGSICRIIKHAVALSGRDASEYSSHSARAGFVSSAAVAQMPLAEIAQVTKHRGIQSLQKYLRVVDQRRTKSLL